MLFLWLAMLDVSQAQMSIREDERAVINNTVDYINKTIDGLLFAHRLFENYNQEVNKYVDLESHQLNPISNQDLPGDIFASEWFYKPTPQQLYEKIVADEKSLPSEIRSKVLRNLQRIQAENARINKIRFEVEQFLNDHDLTQRENLTEIYKSLEEVVDLYTRLYGHMQEVHNAVGNFTKPRGAESEIYKVLASVHESSYDGLLHLRYGDEEGMKASIAKIRAAGQEMRTQGLITAESSTTRSRAEKLWRNILTKSELLAASLEAALGAKSIPAEYEPQGRYYYYYNYDALFHLNAAGPGLGADINSLIDLLEMDGIYVEELPHYFKVVYPKKIEKAELLTIPSKPIINEFPQLDEDREIVLINKRIKSENRKFVIKVYDHMVEDGDIISLKFNGEWVVENQELKKKPMKITLDLNPTGKNYLMLHAENVGSRPPNTVAISYTAFGKKERIILESDFDTSEMIQIDYVQ